MTVWYNPRFDLIGLGIWLEDVFDRKSDLHEICIQSENPEYLARWGICRTIKEWKKVDWILIGEY